MRNKFIITIAVLLILFRVTSLSAQTCVVGCPDYQCPPGYSCSGSFTGLFRICPSSGDRLPERNCVFVGPTTTTISTTSTSTTSTSTTSTSTTSTSTTSTSTTSTSTTSTSTTSTSTSSTSTTSTTTSTSTSTSTTIPLFIPVNTQLCNGTGVIPGIIPSNSATTINGSNITAGQNIINIALLILLIMFALGGVLYAVGLSFRIGSLVRLVRSEAIELFITAIIVLIFLGTFNVVSAGATNNFALIGSTSFNRSIFVQDCSYVTATSFSLLSTLITINVEQLYIDLVSSLHLSLAPGEFGVEIKPLSGLAIVGGVLLNLGNITGALIAILIGTAIILGIFYSLMPLFLYIGIVLRTLPWSRPAGGSFLALFMGFYILFPFLLHLMLASYVPQALAIIQSANPPPNNILSIIGTFNVFNPVGVVLQILNFLNNPFASSNGLFYGVVNGFIVGVVEPVMFTLFAVFLSFFITFDFVEVIAGFLGAPSLKSGDVLRKLI